MIAVKLKTCAGCNQQKYIWKSHKKDKYCKECWYTIEKPKSISPVSKRIQGEMDSYSALRETFFFIHPNCQAKLVGCTGKATDVHHKKGRGDNLLRVGTWLAVCRSCHTWIEENPIKSKELGLSESRLKNQEND